jgi:methyltransferase family protein
VTFSADWLALREPHDLAARNRDVLAAVAAAFAQESSVTVVDLACGTGSTLRALGPHLPARQLWRLVDNDLGLLARAAAAAKAAAASITTTPVDLARDLEAALDGAVDLVTASALLDLVSVEWLERFVVEAAARRLPVYAALSYDGRATLDPADRFDEKIIAAVNRHQRRDKGFGPALGPESAAAATAQFAKVHYTIVQGASDWVLGPEAHDMQREVLSGWATAARETDELDVDDIIGWLTRRRDLVAAGRSSIRVGHVDLFAAPTGMRRADRSQSNNVSSPSGWVRTGGRSA